MEGMDQGAVQIAAQRTINRAISRKSEIDDAGARANKRAFTQQEIDIQDRQEYEIDKIEEFSGRLQRIDNPAYRLGSDDSPAAIAQRQKTIEDVRRYVREDEPSSTVSKKELKERERRYHHKVRLASDSHTVQTELDREIRDQEATVLRVHRETETLGGPQGDPIREQYHIDAIRYIDSLDIDALCYKDDAEFVSKSKGWMLQIAVAEKLASLFDGDAGDEAFEQYCASCKITKPELKRKVRADIAEKITVTLANQKQYIQTKLELIQSPFYALLSKSDLEDLTVDELHEKADFFDQLKKPALANYLRKLASLKGMTDPEGALKLKRSRYVESINSILVREKNGNLTRVTKKFEKGSREVHKKMNGAVVAAPWLHTKGTEKKSDGEDGLSKRDISTITEYMDAEGQVEEVEAKAVEEKAKDYLDDVKGQALSSLGISYDVDGSISAFKGTVSLKQGVGEMSASGSLFSATGTASVGATLFDAEGVFAPNLSASLSGEFNVAEGQISASATKKHAGTGFIFAQANAKAKGAVGKLKAKAKGSIGKIRYKRTKNGKETTIEERGVTVSANVGAYAATGSVSGTLGILGVSATAKAEGSVGIGGNIKYVHTAGRVQLTLGLVMGVGGKLSFTLDYGNALDSLKKIIVKACKKKYRASRREKYGAHKRERGFNLGANAYRLDKGVAVI